MAKYEREQPKITETKPTDLPIMVVNEQVGAGDVIVQKIEGKNGVRYNPNEGKLLLGEGVTVWVSHRELGKGYQLCLTGNPKVTGLDKEAFKKGQYALA